MPKEILIALCLMAILEGLFLFAAPHAWQRTMQELAQQEPRRLRLYGGIAIILGLVFLQFVV